MQLCGKCRGNYLKVRAIAKYLKVLSMVHCQEGELSAGVDVRARHMNWVRSTNRAHQPGAPGWYARNLEAGCTVAGSQADVCTARCDYIIQVRVAKRTVAKASSQQQARKTQGRKTHGRKSTGSQSAGSQMCRHDYIRPRKVAKCRVVKCKVT